MSKKTITGKVSISEKGFGFVASKDHPDVYLSKVHAVKCLDGEVVKIEVHERGGKTEGVLLEIIERKKEGVGKVLTGRNEHYVQLSNFHKVTILNYEGKGAELVRFKFKTYPQGKKRATAEIVEVLGHENSPKIENKLAIFKHEIPHLFGSKIKEELSNIDETISTENRFDLRKMHFVTIDGDDSRDFDDAVYVESTNYGWTLWVAIADVGHYVKDSSELDKEALTRGNSVYFPNEVVPMLPEYLSNGLCSLNPNKDRYAVVSKINISKNGGIKSFKFMNAVINSKARLTYNQVSDMLELEDEKTIDQFSHVYKDLKAFEKLYEVLKENKELRGALEFEKRENKITFDENDHKIENVEFYERRQSHKMIEEAMLCANICAAKLLTKMKIKAVYRVHDKPEEDRLDAVKTILQNIGLTLRGGEKTKTHHFRKMLELASEREDKDFIQSTLLKSMPRATYQVENRGHFGLAYEEYTHFTSPIRRYSDLLVHRAIKGLIASNEGDKYVQRVKQGVGIISDHYNYKLITLDSIAHHISMTERRADSASNEVYDALKCHFLANKVGQTFTGKITHLKQNALFVEFDDFILEGIVSYVDLPDYFVFMEDKAKIKGRRTKQEFKLGDKVKFDILKVNNETNKVYLKLHITKNRERIAQ